jgi:hypothetical protein
LRHSVACRATAPCISMTLVDRRAPKTAYYLNRILRYFALIARGVRLPRTAGVWVPVGDGEFAPWDVTDLLKLAHPELRPDELAFAALLTDFDVEEFEREIESLPSAAAP